MFWQKKQQVVFWPSNKSDQRPFGRNVNIEVSFKKIFEYIIALRLPLKPNEKLQFYDFLVKKSLN